MAAVTAMREEVATKEALAVVSAMARPFGSRACEEVRVKKRDFLRDRDPVWLGDQATMYLVDLSIFLLLENDYNQDYNHHKNHPIND